MPDIKDFPTITLGGELFFNISHLVTVGNGTRTLTDGIAVHHSVGQTEFKDTNFNGTSMDEEIAHITAIDNYHTQQGYGGFGYNAIAFASGRVYVVGDCSGKRAHVAYENGHLVGICMAGTFSDVMPPLGIILGVGRWIKAMWELFPTNPPQLVLGHREWVKPEHAAKWSTSCPGDEGLKAVHGAIIKTAIALREQPEHEAHEQTLLVKAKIKAALEPAFKEADLKTLQAQINYLLGTKTC